MPDTPCFTRLKFSINLGDPSGDGHGKHETYYASALGTIDEVRDAYFKGLEDVPTDIRPEKIANEYAKPWISAIDASRIQTMSKLDIVDTWGDNAQSKLDVDQRGLVEYVIWVINQGNPALAVQGEFEDIPSLNFWGYDKKKRHIGAFGYGLFGE